MYGALLNHRLMVLMNNDLVPIEIVKAPQVCMNEIMQEGLETNSLAGEACVYGVVKPKPESASDEVIELVAAGADIERLYGHYNFAPDGDYALVRIINGCSTKFGEVDIFPFESSDAPPK